MTSTEESSIQPVNSRWVRTLPSSELPTDGTGRTFEAEGLRLALFHHEGKFHALDDACPHQGASLGDGVISQGDITCPFHSWHFDLVTGKNTDSLDACVAVHPVREGPGGVLEVQVRG